MTSEQRIPAQPQTQEVFDDDDVTWPGLVERAMHTARAGRPDPAADRRVLAVLHAAIGAGLDGALLTGMRAEAYAYVMSLCQPTDRLRD